ncbi:MAG: lysophospholipid acyltransferase family protein [Cyanobacteria bacterium J06627_15]
MALASERTFYHLFRTIARPFVQRSVQIRVTGRDYLPPAGAAILVSNHRSDTDPAILSSAIPRYIAWMAADYMTQLPVSRLLMQLTGAVPVSVTGRVAPSTLRQTQRILQGGGLLGIFPEGEQYIFENDFSAPLTDFYPGFAALATRWDVPVVPCVVCPEAERLAPLTIPAAIRADIAQMHDLDRLQQVVRYSAVSVRIGQPIVPEAGPANRRQRIERLILHTRQTMLGLMDSI